MLVVDVHIFLISDALIRSVLPWLHVFLEDVTDSIINTFVVIIIKL